MQLRLGIEDMGDLEEWSESRIPPSAEAGYNIAPSQIIPVMEAYPVSTLVSSVRNQGVGADRAARSGVSPPRA
jgi:hypothetical protein